MNKDITVHMISFNVPYPANYGGVIDVFYQLKTLSELNIKVILHSFHYGRKKAVQLEKYCQEVHYYPRKTGIASQLSRLPYIVYSRRNNTLKHNLLKDNHPILFQGTHCCYLLNHFEFKERLKMVRLHNVEWKYYLSLYRQEKNWVKKLFFKIEASKLKRFEENNMIKNADHLFTISSDETDYFNTFQPKGLEHQSAFHSNESVQCLTGIGNYALYHGDLSVKDNENAALFLIEKIFSKLKVKLILAGLNPTALLIDKAKQHKNVEVKANLSNDEMESIIKNAQINILISFNHAGMKLKLLNALYKGRHCLVNHPIIQNTGLESLCSIKDSPEEIIEKISDLMEKDFTSIEIQKREILLQNSPFSNTTNAKKTVDLLEKHFLNSEP